MQIEITSEEEFKHFKTFRDCFVVITDTTRRTMVLKVTVLICTVFILTFSILGCNILYTFEWKGRLQ